MLWRTCCSLCALFLCLSVIAPAADSPELPDPPVPESHLPPVPVPNCGCACKCQLLSSESFASEADCESLPECHPLPDLLQAQWDGLLLTRLWRKSQQDHAKGEGESFFSPGDSISENGRGKCMAATFASGLLIAAPVFPLCSGAAQPQADPQPHVELTPIDHLRKAAEHLDAAGDPDEARHLRERAADMQHARHRLQQLRNERQRIERVIQQLERLTDRPGQIPSTDNVIGFVAPWCGPCQQMQPVIQRLQRSGFPFRLVNVEEERDFTRRHDVTSLPTFIAVRGHQETSRILGVTSEKQLRTLVSETSGDPAGRVSPRSETRPPLPLHASETETLTPFQHMQRAADLLESGGRHEDAARIRREAGAMQYQVRERLQELRQQRQTIDAQIEQMKALTHSDCQVRLRVSMIEVDQQKLEQLGMTFEMLIGNKTSEGLPHPVPSPGRTPPNVFENVALSELPDPRSRENYTAGYQVRPSEVAALQLEALKQSGVVKVLAEPVLVTPNDREGVVRSGGEFPIPVPLPDGTVRMRWEEFGVKLEATPQVLADGRVRLELACSVVERDFQRAKVVNGIKVPGIKSRRVNTLTEMNFGQTLVIGGLTWTKASQPVPSPLSGLPKSLVRLVSETVPSVGDTVPAPSRKTSLVVFVTPELVTTR